MSKRLGGGKEVKMRKRYLVTLDNEWEGVVYLHSGDIVFVGIYDNPLARFRIE